MHKTFSIVVGDKVLLHVSQLVTEGLKSFLVYIFQCPHPIIIVVIIIMSDCCVHNNNNYNNNTINSNIYVYLS